MTIQEMSARLSNLGLKKTYRPVWEHEGRAILLATRRPAAITDGRLVGCEIALSGDTFRVWTGKKQKARVYAKAHGLKVRLWDGEAELSVPASLADAILPKFGAKTRHELTGEKLAAARLRMERARNGPNLRKQTDKKAAFWGQPHSGEPRHS